MKQKRAALVVRVSTPEQHLENQRPELEAFARARGLEVVEVFEETGSGAARRRPVLQAMLEAAHRRAFDVVLVWSLDRLGRTMLEVLEAVRRLDVAGVELLSVREPWLDTGGPARGLLLAIFAWVAEWERGRLVERTKAGMARARAQGKVIGRPAVAVPLALARGLLHADGKSVRGVARSLGIAPSTLRRALKEKKS